MAETTRAAHPPCQVSTVPAPPPQRSQQSRGGQDHIPDRAQMAPRSQRPAEGAAPAASGSGSCGVSSHFWGSVGEWEQPLFRDWGGLPSPWAGEEQRGLPGTALGAEFCPQNFFLGPVDCGGFILLLNEPSLLQLLFLGDPSMSKSRYFPPHAQTPRDEPNAEDTPSSSCVAIKGVDSKITKHC